MLPQTPMHVRHRAYCSAQNTTSPCSGSAIENRKADS